MKNRCGAVWIAAGILLLTAAFALHLSNTARERYGGRASTFALAQLEQKQKKAEKSQKTEAALPAYRAFPEMEMPTASVGGISYVGVLEIPAISLKLPIHAQCSNALLRSAPCCYAGSAYAGNFVIAGHNYSSHFGALSGLEPGDAVYFTDADGNVFDYAVAELETLAPSQVRAMKHSEYALTLFTCTYGGASRITVRCSDGRV